MTKIYFACSIRGGGDKANYQAVVEAIKSSGAICLSEIFVNDAIELGGSPLPDEEIYSRDISWIEEADAVIAEVSNPSLGVGYELAYAEKIQKPTLTLFAKSDYKKLSAMVSGNKYFRNINYESADDIEHYVAEFIKQLP